MIDAHVHIFPDRVFAAIRRWFDAHAWDIRFRLDAEQIDAFLGERGVERYLALHYAHLPGMAEELNRFVLDFARTHPRCVPSATVLPGEPDAEGIVDRALSAGARAVKIHSHVQCVAPDDPRMIPVAERVLAHDAALVIHCGSAPSLSGYRCDLESITRPERLEGLLRRFPELKVIVPHLGASDSTRYERMLDEFPNLYLDTAMMLSGYFEEETEGPSLLVKRPDRIVYGTDFPNLPYEWDRDLRAIERAPLGDAARSAVLGGHLSRLLAL